MALSDWDTMAVDAEGRPTSGLFVSRLGVEVEIYKNWLYIRDPKAWHEGGPFVEPTVAQVSSGSLTYKDVRIEAKRGPKRGIYCVVTSKRYDYAPLKGCKHCGAKSARGKDKARYHAPACPMVFAAMLGIGCYAYEGMKFVGVTKTEVRFLRDWIHESRERNTTRCATRASSTAGPIRCSGRSRRSSHD
jgi:hypothetical protein